MSLDESDAILDREVTVAIGQSTKTESVKNEKIKLRDLMRLKFREGGKDGPYILQGSSREPTRSNRTMDEQSLMLFDIENGDGEPELTEILKRAGLLYRIYPTHSHMKAETQIGEREFEKLRQPNRSDIEIAREYLREKKRYRPWLLDSITAVKRKGTKSGADYFVTHAPMPRFRVILALDAPFAFLVDGQTLDQRIAEWKQRYLAVADALGFVVDQSCTDPARPMYLPSHPPKTPTPPVQGAKGRLLKLDDYAIAAAADLPSAKPGEPVTQGMKRFLAKFGKVFDAVAFFEDRGEKPRHTYPDRHIDIGCPNEASHTNPDTADRAFTVWSATGSKGFDLFCQHAGCQTSQGKCDRALLLDAECVNRGIKHARELMEWCPGHKWDEQPKQEEKDDDDDDDEENLLEFPDDISIEDQLAREENALVAGLLYPGGQAMMFAPTGEGKTFIALDLAWHLARGDAWNKREVKQSPVLYVALEGVHGFRNRVKAAQKIHGSTGQHFARIAVPVSLNTTDAGKKGVEKIVKASKKLAAKARQGVGLIVIDTQARATAGDEENSNKDMGAYIEDRLGEITRQTGAAMLTIHHPNKNGTSRGASNQDPAYDLILSISKRRVTADKVKDGEGGPLFDFKLRQVELARNKRDVALTSCVVDKFDPAEAQPGATGDAPKKEGFWAGILRLAFAEQVRENLASLFAETGEQRVSLSELRTTFSELGAAKNKTRAQCRSGWYGLRRNWPRGFVLGRDDAGEEYLTLYS